MGRAPCCDKANVKKGPWSPEEDTKLKDYIEKYGTGGNWIALPQKAGLKRCGKSCRLRWLNYLRPNIKHGEFTDEEDRIICSLFATIGSRWSIIAAQLPGRTDNDIKNYWNTKLKKKLMAMAAAASASVTTTTPHSSQRKPPSSSESTFSSFYKDCPNNFYSSSSKAFSGLELPIPSSTHPHHHHHQSNFSTSCPSPYFQNSESNNLLSPPPPPPAPGYYYHPSFIKDNNFFIFGSETSCSSSDGIKQEDHHQMGSGNFQSFSPSGGGGGAALFEDQTQKFMLSSYGENVNHIHQWNNNVKPNGFCGGGGDQIIQTQFDYNDLDEDVKQLISSSSTNMNNNSLFLFDENKTQQEKERERVMYYYY